MKRLMAIAVAALMLCPALSAQKTSADYLAKYNMLVKNLGPAGVGVETHLDRWAADFPEDVDMLLGKFTYYFVKSRSSRVSSKTTERYLGAQPVLTLSDSLGNKTYYYEEYFYEDSLYAMSTQALDKAIKAAPNRLDLRMNKVEALMAYEKESPDMATSSILGLIDYNGSAKPGWKYGDDAADKDEFAALVQDVCATLYKIQSPVALESFRKISEKMLVYEPNNVMFLDNLGTYQFAVVKDHKKALKYYNKVLKIKADDYTAIKNCVLLARRDKNVKLEKKYLAMLVKHSPDETEKLSAQARLDAYNTKK